MNFLTKIGMFFSNIIASKDVSPLLGDTVDLTGGCTGVSTMTIVAEFIADFLFDLFYTVISFVINILDITQLAIYKIMGIGVLYEEYVVLDPNNPLLKFLTNDAITRVFKILVVIAIISIIVYTIFAVAMSEWKAATTGAENKKNRIFGRTLRSFLTLTIFPMFLLFSIIMVNALLAGFNNVFATKSAYQSTIGSNLFVLSAKGANKYRNYANEGVRVPILVDFDDPYNNGDIRGYTEDELLSIYDKFQPTGEELYKDFAYNAFDKFDKSVVYKNGVLYNASSYAGFEKFVTTPEQYQVMADFLEYAITNHVEFAIKNIRDDDIEWKYVDDTVFDKRNTSLTITYKDANNLNKGGESYTVVYTPSSTDISTPISDAFDTISNILAIGDYEDNLFNIMSRDEDSINVVYWETDKVHLKLSNNYKSAPTYVDKILLYEFNRYKYNNTLDYSLEELESGVFENLYKLDKRAWRTDLQKYITTEIVYVVNINNNLYQVYLPDENHATKDSFGDFAYEIIDPSIILEDCTDHTSHSAVGSTTVDYHEDGTACFDDRCLEKHVHKGGSLTALNKCDDREHYEETCSDSGCEKVHYYATGTGYEICDGSACGHAEHLHHYFNNYPECEGIDCDTHNHYHFDGSKFDICYEACYKKHYHANGVLCTSTTCTQNHYHIGEECESPYCDNIDCLLSHYHSDGTTCSLGEDCPQSYHRHSSAVCGLEHLHSLDDGETWIPCGSYNECTVGLHIHNHDWNCNDKNCVQNHYHNDGTYCSNFEACYITPHLHDPCDGCRGKHYYYIDPYYEECEAGIDSCFEYHYHYHLNHEGKYVDCNNAECEKTHYHYIYPTTDNCIYLPQLDLPIRGHYKYDDNVTFTDIKEFKLNGSYSNSVTINGIEVTEYAYYDDILTEVVKQVNWPQKLMNDMQTIYDNINVNLLITNGDWLTQLSTIVGSSMENGWGGGADAGSSQTFDTSMIHPIGLILSELFLNQVAEDRTSYFGNYEFKSSLDEQEIRALLLAICGEENYRQLDLQLKYFADLFNLYMEPVLEEVAYAENFDLLNGDLASVQLYTYKAYLCSLLLSSTCVEYLCDSALAYIGASNFAYAVLENVELTQKIYDYIIARENGQSATLPNINFYVNVTISPDDYKLANKNEKPGAYLGNLYDEMVAYDDFNGLFDVREYSYLEFYNKFRDVDALFFSIGEKPEYTTLAELSADDSITSQIREEVLKAFDFGEIYDYDYINKIIDEYLLSNVKIIVTPSDYSKVVSVVESTFKRYLELDGEYQAYLSGPAGNGIYDKIVAEMTAKDLKESNSDYEYIKSLRDYVKGSTSRWDYVQAANYEDGYKLKGKLNSLIKEADKYKKEVGTLGSGLLSSIGEIFITTKLDVLYECLSENKPEDIEIPETNAKVVYETVLRYAKAHANPQHETFGDIISPSLYDYVEILMEQANSSSTHELYGYKVSTQVLEEISVTIYHYLSELTGLYDLSDVELFENAQAKYMDKILTAIDLPGLDLAQDAITALTSILKSPKDWSNDLSDLILNLQNISLSIDNYLATLEKIDVLNKFYVPYAVTAYVSTHLNTEFDVVVNSKHYTVGGNMTPAKLAEYILGAEVVSGEMDYECVFVDDDYKGLVQFEKDEVNGVETYNKISEYMSYVNEFVCGFGDVAARVYNNTNFLNLSPNSVDELVICDSDDLMKHALDFLTQNDYLPLDILCARFGININRIINNADKNGDGVIDDKDRYIVVQEEVKKIYNDTSGTDLKNHFTNAFDYLFINETRDEIKIDKMTLKDLRTYTIDFIINYEKMDNESDEQNQKRYLALFNLSCADWKQDLSTASIESIAETLVDYDNDEIYSQEQRENIKYQISSYLNDMDYRYGNISILSPVNGNVIVTNKTETSVINGLTADNASMGMVLKLAGIDNRPYEELVGLEYSINFDFTQPDEANGDLFVICTYDEDMHYYVPFMMTNTNGIRFDPKNPHNIKGLALVNEGGELSNWVTKYGYLDAVTSYYLRPDESSIPCYYPIIARGGFDYNNRPTAIRQNGKNIEFYRDDVVIQEANKIGLQSYYISIEDVYTNHGFVSNIVNTVTKWVTGKSLTEKLVESIPRLSVDFDINVPYGINTRVTEDITEGSVFMNFSFDGDSLTMETVYDSNEMNVLMLFFVVIVTFTFIFKALWGVIARLLEIVTLTIVGPLAISTIALKGDTKDKDGNYVEDSSSVYDTWKSTLIDKVLLAFGYIFGLNITFLLYPMVINTHLFNSETAAAFAEVPFLGGMPLWLINSLGMIFMMIALVSAITYAPKLLAKVMNFTDAFAYGEAVQNRVKNTIEEAKDFVSGQRAMDFVADQAKTMKNFIPGIELIEKGKEKIKAATDKAKVAALKVAANVAGLKSGTAKAAINAYADSMKKQQEAKKKYKKDKDAAREKRNEMRAKWD